MCIALLYCYFILEIKKSQVYNRGKYFLLKLHKIMFTHFLPGQKFSITKISFLSCWVHLCKESLMKEASGLVFCLFYGENIALPFMISLFFCLLPNEL